MTDFSERIKDITTTYAPRLNADGAHRIDYRDPLGQRFQFWYWPETDERAAMTAVFVEAGTMGTLPVYRDQDGRRSISCSEGALLDLISAVQAERLTDGSDLIRNAEDRIPATYGPAGGVYARFVKNEPEMTWEQRVETEWERAT